MCNEGIIKYFNKCHAQQQTGEGQKAMTPSKLFPKVSAK